MSIEQPSATAIAMLAGPIKHWWDENWDTQAHWDYVDWRTVVSDGLVEDGWLVYRPHEAFKGRWDERAQSVNDLVLRTSDVICNLTPPGVPSLGTDGEILYAQNHSNALVVAAPPVKNRETGIAELISRMRNVTQHRELVEQEVVLDSIATRPGQEWKVQAATRHFLGHVLRVHHFDNNGQVQATDASRLRLHRQRRNALVAPLQGGQITVPKPDLLKLEVLERRLT